MPRYNAGNYLKEMLQLFWNEVSGLLISEDILQLQTNSVIGSYNGFDSILSWIRGDRVSHGFFAEDWLQEDFQKLLQDCSFPVLLEKNNSENMLTSSEQCLIPASADEEFSVRLVKQEHSANDLAPYLLNLDPGSPYFLEEVLFDLIGTKRLPYSSELKKRLMPAVVQDPFAHANNLVSSERALFVKEISDVHHLQDNADVFFQSYDFCSMSSFLNFINSDYISSSEKLCLEEPMIGSDVNKGDSLMDQIKEDVIINLQPEDLKEVTSEMCTEEIGSYAFHLEHMSDISVDDRFSVSISDHQNKSERGVLFIESPVLKSNLCIQEYVDICMALPENLKEENLDYNLNEAAGFLNVVTETELFGNLWQREKYLDEVQLLLLRECKVEPGLPEDVNMLKPDNAKFLLMLTPEETALLEMELPWDPLQSLYCLMSNVEKNFSGPALRNSDPAIFCYKVENDIYEHQTCKADGGDFSSPIIIENKLEHTQQVTDNVERMTCSTGLEKHPVKLQTQVSSSADTNNESNDMQQFDPLDQFIMLRHSVVLPSKLPLCQQKQDISSSVVAVVQPCRVKSASALSNSTHSSELHADMKSFLSSPFKILRDNNNEIHCSKEPVTVIDVDITEPFDTLLQMIEKTVHPFISLLIHHHILVHGQDFRSLGLDVIEFIVKQQQTKFKNITSWKQSDLSILRAALCVQTLRITYDQLRHCSLVSACDQLLNIIKQNQTILGDILDNFQLKLVMEMNRHHQKNIVHPKISQMCKLIQTFLVDKLRDDAGGRLVLIILPSCLCRGVTSSCDQYLLDNLSIVDGLRPLFILTLEALQHAQVLNTHNCFLIDECHCADQLHIPSRFFMLIIEFSYISKSRWKDCCQGQANIHFIGLKLNERTISEERLSEKMTKQNVLSVSPGEDLIHFHASEANDGETNPVSPSVHQQISIAVSQNLITNEEELMLLLETRYNIMIIGRDYSSIGLCGYFEDIAIDEASCLVIQNVMKLQHKHEMESLVMRINGLKLKFLACWIILYSSRKQLSDSSCFYSSNIINISKLQASISVLSGRDFVVKIIFCHSNESIATHIRHIANNVYKEKSGSDQTEVASLIKEEPSKDERFLLLFPCLNSISAQMLLSASSIKHLLTMPKVELFDKGLLHVRILQAFDEFRISVGEIFLTLTHAQQGMMYNADDSSSCKDICFKNAASRFATAAVKPSISVGYAESRPDDEEDEKGEKDLSEDDRNFNIDSEFSLAHTLNEFQQAELFAKNFEKIGSHVSNFDFKFSNEEKCSCTDLLKPTKQKPYEDKFAKTCHAYSNSIIQKNDLNIVDSERNLFGHNFVFDTYLRDGRSSEDMTLYSSCRPRESLQLTEKNSFLPLVNTQKSYITDISNKSQSCLKRDEVLHVNQISSSVFGKDGENFGNATVDGNSFLYTNQTPTAMGDRKFVNHPRSSFSDNEFREPRINKATYNGHTTDCCDSNLEISTMEFDQRPEYVSFEVINQRHLSESSRYSCPDGQSCRKSESVVPDGHRISNLVKRQLHQQPALVKMMCLGTSKMAHRSQEQTGLPWKSSHMEEKQNASNFNNVPVYCKKRKLVFEKDNASKSGQTKLKFI